MSLSYSSLERALPAPVTYFIFVGTFPPSLLSLDYRATRTRLHVSAVSFTHQTARRTEANEPRMPSSDETLQAVLQQLTPLDISLVTRAANPLPDSTLTAISLAAPSPLTTTPAISATAMPRGPRPGARHGVTIYALGWRAGALNTLYTSIKG
jgi:hypothetical protein